ncbi:MAG: glycerol-3-phosphate 1-O-acyltransferase PlsY [Pseudomonadota bacterium]
MTKKTGFFTHLIFGCFGLISALWVFSAYFFWANNAIFLTIPVLCGLSYLIGSIPAGPIIAYLMGIGDLRKIGSGNIGATNVLRTGNKKAAFFTLCWDMFKGTLALLLCQYIANVTEIPLQILFIFAAFAFIGHIFPVWLGFRGGKGVATYIGVLLGISPIYFAVAIFSWLGAVFLTKISSVGAITMSIIAPLFLYFYSGDSSAVYICTAMSLILLLKHSANISRLLKREEAKI